MILCFRYGMNKVQESAEEIKSIHFWFYALHDLIPNLDYDSETDKDETGKII